MFYKENKYSPWTRYFILYRTLRGTERVIGVAIAGVVVEVEGPRVRIVIVTSTVEPRIGAIHEVRVRAIFILFIPISTYIVDTNFNNSFKV